MTTANDAVKANPQDQYTELTLGWAAVRRGAVIAFIPTRSPGPDVDFEKYRVEARAFLATMGEVKTGHTARKPDGSYCFLARLNHDRRSTSADKPRPELPIAFLSEPPKA